MWCNGFLSSLVAQCNQSCSTKQSLLPSGPGPDPLLSRQEERKSVAWNVWGVWFCCMAITFHLAPCRQYKRMSCSFCITDGMAETCSWKKNQRAFRAQGENVKAHTLSQATSGQGFFGRAEAQLPTHHGGRQQAPVVITYGAPLAVFQHLHSALAYDGPPTETDQRLLRTEMETLVKDVTAKNLTAYLVFFLFQKWQSQLKLFLVHEENVEAADWVASCLYNMLLVPVLLLTVYTNWKCEINTSMVQFDLTHSQSRAQTA